MAEISCGYSAATGTFRVRTPAFNKSKTQLDEFVLFEHFSVLKQISGLLKYHATRSRSNVSAVVSGDATSSGPDAECSAVVRGDATAGSGAE